VERSGEKGNTENNHAERGKGNVIRVPSSEVYIFWSGGTVDRKRIRLPQTETGPNRDVSGGEEHEYETRKSVIIWTVIHL